MALSRARSEDKLGGEAGGGAIRPGGAAWAGGGGVMAPRPLRHAAPSQAQGEAGRPPTAGHTAEETRSHQLRHRITALDETCGG